VAVLSRIEKKINKHGESFLINGTTAAKGFFRVLDSGTMRNYLDDVEIMAVIKPALFLVTLQSTPIAVDNTIARDGRTYVVRKVATERFAGVAVAKVAILSE
jgi:hypothetical protein